MVFITREAFAATLRDGNFWIFLGVLFLVMLLIEIRKEYWWHKFWKKVWAKIHGMR